MLSIPCNKPLFIFGDNQLVLANTTAPTSQLKKKSNSIAYHFVRNGCTKDELHTTNVNMDDNCADLITKVFSSGSKHDKHIRVLLWWL
ncbi:hypothetical protein ACHAWF_018707 [Thalassiosira exigua]